MANITLKLLPTEARDIALGQYMDAFGRLEMLIKFATQELLQIDWAAANAISATVMTKQSIDLLEAAAKLRLTEGGAARVHRICEKLSRRNMRRNHIVHGTWMHTVVITDDGATQEWVRTYSHTDPTMAQLPPSDPKKAGIYTFTVPELARATDHVQEMVLALSALMEDIPSLRVPPPAPEGSGQA